MSHLRGLIRGSNLSTQGTSGQRQRSLPLLLDQSQGNQIRSSSHHDNLNERILPGQGRRGAEARSWLNWIGADNLPFMTALTQEPKSILCFGDSNTWGFNPDGGGRFPYDTRWPNQLEQQLNLRSSNQTWRTIEDGLNSRTWLLDDPIGAARYGAQYSCSGRSGLMTSLHTHKPIDVVILALGCNDCKDYLHLSAEQIANGARILIQDIRSSLNCGPLQHPDQPPTIVLMTPPLVQITPQSLSWGFEGADTKSQALSKCYLELADELALLAFDVQTVASASSLDGIHFDNQSQGAIASALADLIAPT
jgi:lysophospholipase L1-like esterase